MKKQLLSLLLILTLLLSALAAGSIHAGADGAQNDRTASYAEVTPKIDGTLDDVWMDTELHLISSKTEAQGCFRVMWDETGLYVAVFVGDSERNYVRLQYSERATANLPLHHSTDVGIGNRIFRLYKDGTTEGHWLNKSSENADLVPQNGKNGVEIASAAANGGTWIECYFPLNDPGAFDKDGEIIFALTWGDSDWNNNGVVNVSLLSYNTNTWGACFYKMQRVRNHATDNGIGWLGAQQTPVQNSSCDVRFVAELSDFESYTAAGFEIALSHGTADAMQVSAAKPVQVKTVYTSLIAGQGCVYPTRPGYHLFAFAVYGIPVNDANTTVIFTVKPFAVNSNGEKSWGDVARFRLDNGELSGEHIRLSTGEVPLTVQSPRDGRNMVLAWNDEFDGTSLNRLNWQLKDRMWNSIIDTSDHSEKHIKLQDGSVVMNTYRADESNSDYQFTTHGTLTTMNRMSFQYGYLEIRAKLPYGSGTWPAFWLQSLEERRADVSVMTEVDVFELYKEDYMEATLHKWYLNEKGASEKHDWNDPKVIKLSSYIDGFDRASFSQEYHLYGFGWTATEIYFTVDGTVIGVYDITNAGDFGAGLGKVNNASDGAGALTGMACFRDPLFVNFTNWVNTSGSYKNSWKVEDDSVFPFTFALDYIRLYQVSGEGSLYCDY